MTLTYINRLNHLDHLIKIKGTGSPIKLAGKLGISKSQVFEYLNTLKSLGAPIAYSRSMQSYYYKTYGGFKFTFHSVQ